MPKFYMTEDELTAAHAALEHELDQLAATDYTEVFEHVRSDLQSVRNELGHQAAMVELTEPAAFKEGLRHIYDDLSEQTTVRGLFRLGPREWVHLVGLRRSAANLIARRPVGEKRLPIDTY